MAQGKKNTSGGISARVIIIAAAIVVAVAAGIAVLASGGDESVSTDTTVNTIPGGAQPAEYQEVDAEKDKVLEKLDKNTVDTELGKIGPNLTGFNFAGVPVSIKPATDGVPTLLVFLAHWCPHCNAEMPRLVRWYEKGLVPDDLRVVGIATASRKDQPNWPPSEWMQSFDWPFENMADTETNTAGAAYGVDGYPFMVVMDGQGKVVARHSGEMDEDEIPNFINKALGR